MADVSLNSELGRIADDLPERAGMVVEKTALDIEAGCKVRSRVDTGQMKAGWGTEYVDEHSREVGNPVEHTIYNEFGTRHMGAQPMLAPSIEEARVPFQHAVKELFE